MSEQSNYGRGTTDSVLAQYWNSRNGIRFVCGLPAITLLFMVALSPGWLRGESQQRIVPAYKKEYSAAIEADEIERAEIALNSLIQMLPTDQALKYRLAQLRFQKKQLVTGLGIIQKLSDDGYTPASEWLASFLMAQHNLQPEKLQQVIELCLQIVKSDSKHATANALLGDAYLRLKQPDLAAPYIKTAARLDPVHWLTFAERLSRMGHSKAAREKAELAASALGEAVAENPASSERRIQWSRALRLNGKLQTAVETLQRGLNLEPDNRELKSEMCRVITDAALAERAGGIVNFERFSDLLQKALSYNPRDEKTINELTTIPVDKHTLPSQILREIQADTQRKLKDTPKNRAALERLAWTEFMLDRKSLVAFEQQEKIAAKHPAARLTLAEWYAAIGDWKNSKANAVQAGRWFQGELKKLKQTEDSGPLNPQVAKEITDHKLRLAQSYEILERWEPALQVLQPAKISATTTASEKTVLNKNKESPQPDNETASRERDRLALARSRYALRYFNFLNQSGVKEQRQIELLTELLQNESTQRLAIAGLGLMAQSSTEIGNQCRRKLQTLLTQGKHTLQIHTQFGTNALFRGDYQTAVDHLEQAERRAPDDPLICNNLAWSMAHLDSPHLERALRLIDRAAQRLPNNPKILETRGLILTKMERYTDALHDLEIVLESGENGADIHKLLASVYDKLGNKKMATQHRQQASASKTPLTATKKVNQPSN